jgi:hypothetical protein
MPPGMLWTHQLFEFAAQDFHLLVAQDANPFEISVLMKEFDLFCAQAITFPVLSPETAIKQSANRAMIFRQVLNHWTDLR